MRCRCNGTGYRIPLSKTTIAPRQFHQGHTDYFRMPVAIAPWICSGSFLEVGDLSVRSTLPESARTPARRLKKLLKELLCRTRAIEGKGNSY